MSLKSSKYNHFVIDAHDKNSILGCNFLYRSIVKLPIEIHLAMPKLLPYLTNESISFESDELEPDWLNSLKESGFIVEEDADELSVIKLRYNTQLYNSDTLRLTILPTLWCNLVCPYCFEEKQTVFMDEEVENALLEWMKTNFSTKRHISVAWFGGEPLLCKKAISRLSEKMQDFASSIGATYSASMTTNGFYFDKEFHELIPQIGLQSVQITIDGNREDHDKLRVHRNGAGSFDEIYQNIIDFCESDTSDCELTLRVNCTDENYAGVERLIESFPSEVTQRVRIFFRWIWPNEASGYKEFAQNLQAKEPFKPLYDMYEHSRSHGWSTSNPDSDPTSCYCEVDYLDQFHIDPRGNLYLCSHTFRESESIGSVFGGCDYIKPEASPHYVKWYASGPFDDSECVACKLLPMCGGGCRKSRTDGKKQCIEEKQTLDLYARDFINQVSKQNA